MLATFSMGSERVKAAALLFTRVTDADSHLGKLLGAIGPRDAMGWRSALGWYADISFTSLIGESLVAPTLFRMNSPQVAPKAPTSEA